MWVVVAPLCRTLCDPMDYIARQGPLSVKFSRQEYWSGLPFPSPMQESEKWKWSYSVVSDSQRPHGLQPTRLLHPWDFPGKSTGVGCHCLLWGYSLQGLKRLRHDFVTKQQQQSIVWRNGTLLASPVVHGVTGHFSSCVWYLGRTDGEAETPILWPPDAKSWLSWKDPDAGKDWGQEEKGTTEDEMVGWHHRPNGHGFGWTLGVGDGQGGLACCGSWGRKESDMTEWLNWTQRKGFKAGQIKFNRG